MMENLVLHDDRRAVPAREMSAPVQGEAPTVWDRAATAAAIGFGPLVDALRTAVVEYQAGLIHSPERLSVPLADGGVALSMPASAADIAIHKLVTVQPANARHGRPTLHGIVTLIDAATGEILCGLDGPEVTGRRTAGISLLAMATFLPTAPEEIVLIGTGAQAAHHVAGIHALYPACRVLVRGIDPGQVEAFCQCHRVCHPSLAPCPDIIPESAQVVITLTTSKEIVYDLPASPGRLVIGVGAFRPDMAEIGSTTLHGSRLFADDPAGARHEAGDLLRAGIDWQTVRPLAAALSEPPRGQPVVVKSVGTAAWDLAAARVALSSLQQAPRSPNGPGFRPSRPATPKNGVAAHDLRA